MKKTDGDKIYIKCLSEAYYMKIRKNKSYSCDNC